MKKINVGLMGFGIVGSGMTKILLENQDVIEPRLGTSLVLKWIADLDLERDRGVDVDPGILTQDAEMVINDKEVDIVVELIGGYEPARSLILKAIENGKHVVTANKALLAAHGLGARPRGRRSGAALRGSSVPLDAPAQRR